MSRTNLLIMSLVAIFAMVSSTGCGRAEPVIDIKNASDIGNGEMSLSYLIKDIDENNADLVTAFSLDGGLTYREATAGSGGDGITGLATSQKGTLHTYVWNYSADIGPGFKENVRLWLIPIDPEGNHRGEGDVTGPLTFGSPILYVANFDNDTVSVINTDNFGENNSTVTTITVGDGPYRMAYVRSKQKLYVGNRLSGTVSVIDTKTNTLGTTITIGNDPFALAVSPDEERVYVANKADDSVAGISTTHDTVFDIVSVGDSPSGITVGEANFYTSAYEVYVTNSLDNSVSVITVDSAGTLNVSPSILSVGVNPQGIAVSPNGVHLWVVCTGSDQVRVYETATLFTSGAAIINVGQEPIDIVFPENGQLAYVNNFAAHNIAKIDANYRSVISFLPCNNSPTTLAVSTDGSKLYVSNLNNAQVTAIDTDTSTIQGIVPTGSSPAGLSIMPGRPEQ